MTARLQVLEHLCLSRLSHNITSLFLVTLSSPHLCLPLPPTLYLVKIYNLGFFRDDNNDCVRLSVNVQN